MNAKCRVATMIMIFSGIACAADDPQAAYAAADTDQNGVITEAEADNVPGLTEQWNEIDANQDGQIDVAEFARFEVKPAE